MDRQIAVGRSLGVLVRDVHVVQSAVSWGPEKGSFDVLAFGEKVKHVLSKDKRCLLCWMRSRGKNALESGCQVRKNAELPYVWLPKHGLVDQLGSV